MVPEFRLRSLKFYYLETEDLNEYWMKIFLYIVIRHIILRLEATMMAKRGFNGWDQKRWTQTL